MWESQARGFIYYPLVIVFVAGEKHQMPPLSGPVRSGPSTPPPPSPCLSHRLSPFCLVAGKPVQQVYTHTHKRTQRDMVGEVLRHSACVKSGPPQANLFGTESRRHTALDSLSHGHTNTALTHIRTPAHTHTQQCILAYKQPNSSYLIHLASLRKTNPAHPHTCTWRR